MGQESLASQIDVLVDGSPLSAEIMADVIEVIVEQHAHLPGMVTIRVFDDKDHTLIDGTTFDLTKEVEVKGYTSAGTSVSLISAEIVSVEPVLSEGMQSELVVQAYQKSHRLFREVASNSFLNIKDSDLASQIAGRSGLSPQVDTTSTVYDHLFQHNQSDLAFLTQRAWRIGYECFVDDGKLYFRKPPTSGTTQTLKWGENMISFRARESLAEQVDDVKVKGWDPESLQAIVGTASKGTLYPSSTAGGQYTKAGSFGIGSLSYVDMPVVSQSEANEIAQARLDEVSGAFLVAEGVAFQVPGVRAGQFVEIEGVGTKYSGKYMVTEARHTYSIEKGLTCRFTARGARNGLLAEQLMQQEPLDRWPGVVFGVVTNTDDPNDWGRVKVKFPWLSDSDESWWARLVAPGAGPQAGLCAIPEVGDEVAVIFEHGDFNRPVIIGGLWNGRHQLPTPVPGGGAGERPLIQAWQSRTGHWYAMYDTADNKVEIITAGGHYVTFDDANKVVEIATSGGHKVTMDDQGKKLELASAGGHKLTMDDNGRSLKLSSTGSLEISASTTFKITGGATGEVSSSAPLTLKGAVVNIN